MAAELEGMLVGNIRNWSRGSLEEVPDCPACGNHESNPDVYERHDDGGVMPDVWRMVRCSNCRSLYLDPRPDKDSLPRAYEDYYTHQAEAVYNPETGASGLMWRAQDMGWSVVGCEPDLRAVEACGKQGLRVFCGDAFCNELEKNSFDVITLSHVIEHVVDPALLLRRVLDLLRPSGVLWLALPNPESVGMNTFGPAWRGLHTPYHLCIPTRRVLSCWLVAAGFSVGRPIRRGAHARRQWVDSQAIARREGIRLSPPLMLLARRAVADLLSTFSAGWAEETVMVARRPGHQYGC